MQLVYLAEDRRLERQVALKFLPPYLTHNPEARHRFLNEARLAAKLNHPNIATVYESDEVHGRIYIAMEFVEGASLKDLIGAGPISLEKNCSTRLPEVSAERSTPLQRAKASVTSSGLKLGSRCSFPPTMELRLGLTGVAE